MDLVKLFRALIAAMVACMVATMAAALLEPDPPDAITDWFVESGGGFLTPVFNSGLSFPLLALFVVCLAFVIAWTAAVIGMVRFRPWSPKLFIGCMVFGYLWLPFVGHTWTKPVEGTLSALTFSCEGAILVLLFVPQIRDRFGHATQTDA
jgi:hypothetical protein